MSDDPIVVTGLGAVCPLGTGAASVWRAFGAGESGIRELAPDDDRLAPGVDVTPPAPVRRAGWVRGFRPRDHVRSPQLRRMDWCSRMAVASIRQAFEDAALLPLDDATSTRTALVVGSCYGNQRETAVYLQRVFASGPAAGQPLLFPNLVLNAAAGYAAIELDVRGPNVCVAEHEASGEAALATALDLLESGACDVACVAGVDEIGAVQLDALSELRLLHPDAAPEAAGRRRPGRRARSFPEKALPRSCWSARRTPQPVASSRGHASRAPASERSPTIALPMASRATQQLPQRVCWSLPTSAVRRSTAWSAVRTASHCATRWTPRCSNVCAKAAGPSPTRRSGASWATGAPRGRSVWCSGAWHSTPGPCRESREAPTRPWSHPSDRQNGS